MMLLAEFSVAMHSAAVNVTAPVGWLATWQSLLAPYFQFGDMCPSPYATIRVVNDRLTKTSQLSSYSLKAHMHKGAVIYKEATGAFFAELTDGSQVNVCFVNSIDITYFSPNGDAPLDLMRLLRGLLARGICSATKQPCHASAIDIEGFGVAFTGPSGSGKTSFLLAMLKHLPDVAIVTNDKGVFDHRTGILYGLPFAMTVSPETLTAIGETPDPIDDRFIGGEWLIWPQKFAHKKNRGIASQTSLSVLAEVNLSLEATEIAVVDKSASRLSSPFASFADLDDNVSWNWIFSVVPDASRLRIDGKFNLPAQVRQIEIYGNPYSKNSMRDLVNQMREIAIS